MVQEATGILRHQRRGVERAVVELVAGAVATVVDGDDAEAMAGEEAHPAGLDPIVLRAGGKAVDQQHGLARTLVDEAETDAVRYERVHAHSGLLSTATCPLSP